MRLFWIVLGVLVLTPLFAEVPFGISFEQDGQAVSIRNGVVTLRKAPFTMVFNLSEPLEILMNYASEPKLYNLFRKQGEIEPPIYFMAMAEYPLNRDRLLIIDNTGGAHYIYYINPRDNAFDSTVSNSNGIIGRREVQSFMDDDFEARWKHPAPAKFWLRDLDERIHRIGLLPYDTVYMSLRYFRQSGVKNGQIIPRTTYMIQFR